MKINEAAVPVIIQQLEQAYQSGQKWFSFPVEETLDEKPSLEFYPNFKAAGEACYEAVDQDKYLSTKDIPSALRELRGIPQPEADPALVRKALEQDQVTPLYGAVQLVSSLARGELRPVIFEQQSLFTRYNESTGRLNFYDGAMDLVDPRSLKRGIGLDEYYSYIDREPVQLTISSSIKTSIMDEKTMSFNETQLKRVGFAEAFTPDLQQKMKESVPVIQHPFTKEYDGDKVDATLHLKKSATSDHYFLNKYDLQLQKDGQADSVKQTFYLTTNKKETGGEEDNQQKAKQENKYTLKEAYNLLAGRPVHKSLVSKEGNEYEAWVKLNFKNKLDNGNHELKQYTKNYGFELENVLAKYPIKELTNDQYKQSLVDSLQRGNLQKATFVNTDGKEEKLYISPNVTLGALNVYDQNKQRLTTEMLVDKQYIGKELAEDLKQRVSQQQKPEPTPKQEQKQKDETPVKKQTHKQKVH